MVIVYSEIHTDTRIQIAPDKKWWVTDPSGREREREGRILTTPSGVQVVRVNLWCVP